MKHAKISIVLAGTEGLLDIPEREYVVLHLQDQAENARRRILEILEQNPEYKNFGWTMISAHKIYTEEEVEKLLEEIKASGGCAREAEPG